MPVPADSDDPEDFTELELTSEQRENLRKSIDGLSRSIASIDPELQNIVSPALPKLVADMLKLPSFNLPEWALKNLTPIEGQALWAKRFSTVNNDVFKSIALMQPTLSSTAAEIVKNADFGLSGTFAHLAQQLAAQQSSWIKNLGPTLERLKASFYPSNLRDIAGLRLAEVEQVVMIDGIALYQVPRPAIAEALVRADGTSKRRGILGQQWKAIMVDCQAAVSGCTTKAVAPYVSVTAAALNALENGHVEASQALTGSLIDALVNTYFGKDRSLYTPNRSGNRTNDAYEEFGAHEYIAFAPIWQAWQKFFPDEGDPIPYTFSRNATAHTVSARQYTRRNAVQGLMIVCGILVFLDEQAKAVEVR